MLFLPNHSHLLFASMLIPVHFCFCNLCCWYPKQHFLNEHSQSTFPLILESTQPFLPLPSWFVVVIWVSLFVAFWLVAHHSGLSFACERSQKIKHCELVKIAMQGSHANLKQRIACDLRIANEVEMGLKDSQTKYICETGHALGTRKNEHHQRSIRIAKTKD